MNQAELYSSETEKVILNIFGFMKNGQDSFLIYLSMPW